MYNTGTQIIGNQIIGNQAVPQRSYVYPAIWAFYLIGFIVIAHCFDASGSGLSLPSMPGTHLASVFGLGSFEQQPCVTNCRTQQPPSTWGSLHLTAPTDTCSNISINPDLQSGCGFTLGTTSQSAPTPSADLSASAPEELLAPADELLENSASQSPAHTSDQSSALQ